MNRGTTLLETLFGLALSSLTLSLVAIVFMRLQAYYQNETERHREISTLSIFRGHFQRIASNIDSLRHNTTPVVHLNGAVRLADGTPHTIMNLSAVSRPKVGSDAISSIEVSASHALEVRSSKMQMGALSLDVCPRYKAIQKIDRPKSFLALSFNNSYQLIPSVSSKIYFEKCSTINLLPIPSVFFKTPRTETLPEALLLVPIISEFTIYIDRSDQLRYISHTGLNLQENQPIARSLKQLGFSLDNFKIGAGSFIRLKSQITLRGRKTKTFELNNLLSRTNPLQTLYARAK